MIERVVPAAPPVDAAFLLAELRTSAGLPPFSAELQELCASFSSALFKDTEARQHAEIQALAFWMRKSELRRLQEAFCALAGPDSVLVPRGVVFHVPPSNVDTIFVYSWLLAILTGNRSIVRLSHRAGEPTLVLCKVLNRLLAEASPDLRRTTQVIRYAHDPEITAQLSANCDVRVIWGGDQTVRSIREIPLPPHAVELTFPDRTSLAVLHAAAYLSLATDEPRDELAGRFYNDVFWFDQMACSSPRRLFWCGPPRACDEAGSDFYPRVARWAERKQYPIQTATRLGKFTFGCRAILDGAAETYREFGKLTVLGSAVPGASGHDYSGGGVLFDARIESLEDLVPWLGRHDQTLAHFGFDRAALRAFAVLLNGRAIDRLVPVGQALTFQRFWDGYDLLAAFSRRVGVTL